MNKKILIIIIVLIMISLVKASFIEVTDLSKGYSNETHYVGIVLNMSIDGTTDSNPLPPEKLIPDQIENLTSPSKSNITVFYAWNLTIGVQKSLFYLDGLNIANISSPTNSYNLTGLVPATTYNATIIAWNSTGVNLTNSTENSILVTTDSNPLPPSPDEPITVDITLTLANYRSDNESNIICFDTHLNSEKQSCMRIDEEGVTWFIK